MEHYCIYRFVIALFRVLYHSGILVLRSSSHEELLSIYAILCQKLVDHLQTTSCVEVVHQGERSRSSMSGGFTDIGACFEH